MTMLPDMRMMRALHERNWRRPGSRSLMRYLRSECCELPKDGGKAGSTKRSDTGPGSSDDSEAGEHSDGVPFATRIRRAAPDPRT